MKASDGWDDGWTNEFPDEKDFADDDKDSDKRVRSPPQHEHAPSFAIPMGQTNRESSASKHGPKFPPRPPGTQRVWCPSSLTFPGRRTILAAIATIVLCSIFFLMSRSTVVPASTTTALDVGKVDVAIRALKREMMTEVVELQEKLDQFESDFDEKLLGVEAADPGLLERIAALESAPSTPRVTRLEKQVLDLTGKVDDLSTPQVPGPASHSSASRAELETRILAAEAQGMEAKAQVDQLEADLTASQSRIDTLEKKVKSMEDTLSRALDAITDLQHNRDSSQLPPAKPDGSSKKAQASPAETTPVQSSLRPSTPSVAPSKAASKSPSKTTPSMAASKSPSKTPSKAPSSAPMKAAVKVKDAAPTKSKKPASAKDAVDESDADAEDNASADLPNDDTKVGPASESKVAESAAASDLKGGLEDALDPTDDSAKETEVSLQDDVVDTSAPTDDAAEVLEEQDAAVAER